MLTINRPAPTPALAPVAPQRFPFGLVLWASVVFALQIGIARLGYGLALPAIRESLHGSYTLYGTINAASLGGYLAGALFAPLAIRRLRSAVLVSSVVGGAGLAVSAFAGDVLVFGLARTAFGVASGVSLVAAAVETLERAAAPKRGVASAIMWGGIGVGLIVSAFAAAWLVYGGIHWRIASLASGVLTAAAGAGYSYAARGSSHGNESSTQKNPALRGFLFLNLSYFSFGFAYIVYATFIVAAVTARLGLNNAHLTIEHLWAAYGVTSIAGTVAIGRILDRPLGRAAMAFAGLSGSVGCAVAFLSMHAIIVSALLVGLGLTATPAAATALVRKRSNTSSAAGAIAAATVAVGLGQLAGPVIAGVAADHFGLSSVALVACCAYISATILASVDALIGFNGAHIHR